jgi:hypothetical protein
MQGNSDELLFGGTGSSRPMIASEPRRFRPSDHVMQKALQLARWALGSPPSSIELHDGRARCKSFCLWQAWKTRL